MVPGTRALVRWLARITLLTWASVCGACQPSDDCALYGTCVSLHERARENFAKAGDECGDCIDGCRGSLDACSENPLCSYRARCQLSSDPQGYQRCLEDLSQRFSDGTEERRPWESGPPEDLNGAFEKAEGCFKKCRDLCVDPVRWACGPVPAEDPSVPGRARLAVRVFPGYTAVPRVPVESCKDEGGEISCVDKAMTSADGTVELDLAPGSREFVFFKIGCANDDPECPVNGKVDFPLTRFYPGYLSASKEQPVAAYVVSTATIALNNGLLQYGNGVLGDRGQSLVLTDSCVWDDVSAPGVRLSASKVRGEAIGQCHEAECACPADDRHCECPPCIWHGKKKLADRDAKKTDGTGAGVVGLEPGRYTVRVEADDDTGTVFSERSFTIDEGEMVVMRTWPNVATQDGSQ